MCEQNHSFIPSWEKLNCQAGGQTVNESKRENQCLEGMCQLGFDKIWRTNLAAEISSLLITATWSFCCVTNLPKTYDSKRQALNLAQNPMGQPGDSPGLRWPSHPWLGSLLCLWSAGRSAGGWTMWDGLIHTPVDGQAVDRRIHQRSGLPSTTFFAILALSGSHHESSREEIVKFCFSVPPICTHSAQDPSSFETQYKIFFFLTLFLAITLQAHFPVIKSRLVHKTQSPI